MQGAFVIRLRKVNHSSQLEGLVEEVDTGREARFHSGDELIDFLRESTAGTQQGDQHNEGTDERKNNRD